MTSIEETGKDIEEATQRALEKLGVTEDEVDVEILAEGAKGFLGLGHAPACVRVTVKETPKAKRAPRRAAPASKPEEPVLEGAPTSGTESGAEVLESAAEISLESLQRILDGMYMEAKADVQSASDGQVVLNVSTDKPAIVIGKHGQTIDAIQYLVGVITNKRLAARVRVIVDTEGYRGRREEALRNQAYYLASKVRETHQEAVLESLRANERRIIHLALADDPDIYTYSEGEEPDRRVVISPRK